MRIREDEEDGVRRSRPVDLQRSFRLMDRSKHSSKERYASASLYFEERTCHGQAHKGKTIDVW